MVFNWIDFVVHMEISLPFTVPLLARCTMDSNMMNKHSLTHIQISSFTNFDVVSFDSRVYCFFILSFVLSFLLFCCPTFGRRLHCYIVDTTNNSYAYSIGWSFHCDMHHIRSFQRSFISCMHKPHIVISIFYFMCDGWVQQTKLDIRFSLKRWEKMRCVKGKKNYQTWKMWS